jgi:hypothetical protein
MRRLSDGFVMRSVFRRISSDCSLKKRSPNNRASGRHQLEADVYLCAT